MNRNMLQTIYLLLLVAFSSATPANVILASMNEDMVVTGDLLDDFNSNEIIPVEYDAPEDFAPVKIAQQPEEKAEVPFTEPVTQAPVLEPPIRATAFSSPEPLVSSTSNKTVQKNVTGDNKDEPSTTARLSVLLKADEMFCVHQRFNYGDTVDVFYNIAPETYKRVFQFEFVVIENLIPKEGVKVQRSEHTPLVLYRSSARRHGMFSITVKRGKPEEQDGALYDFCFDTIGNPSTSIATLALTRTSGREYEVLQALVRNQVTTMAAQNGSAVDPDKVPPHLMADENDLLMLANEEGRNKLASSTIKAIRAKLRVCSSLLRQLSDVERSGRSKAEGNFTLVNKWSAIQVVAMVFSTMVQLVTIKSLFIDESRIRRLFQAIFGRRA